MSKTVNACVKLGISSFAMIHDSFGTHSARMPELSDVLREEFITMYITHDVLEELRDHAREVLGEEAELPDLPAKGTLNIVEVFNSEYFFS
jgi:DNA-directed RNA polymerase, mitochondrial